MLVHKSEPLVQDSILAEMVQRLVAEFHPYKIYLFGSRASGTAREDSDYDLLVVMSELTDEPRKLSGRAYDILDDFDAATDILFTSKDKFERRKTIANTIAEIAINDGKEIYIAA